MRFIFSIILTAVFLFGFALAEENKITFSILSDELETAEREPLDDSKLRDLPKNSEAVPKNQQAVSDADPFVQPDLEEEQPDSVFLPEGISEEEANWANWSDWDKVGVEKDEFNAAPQQKFIAPQTEEDALVDQSQAMDKSSVPVFNENLDVTRQISVEPEMSDRFETVPGQNEAERQPQDENREENVTDYSGLLIMDSAQSDKPSSGGNEPMSFSDLVENETAEPNSSLPQDVRYLESFSLRQDKPAEINERISEVIEKIKVVRRQFFDKQLNTENNSPFEAMMSVCAFGCYTSIFYTPQNEKFNTAGALCWNYPMCETSILAINPNPSAAEGVASSISRDSEKKFTARYPHGRLATVPVNASGTVSPYIGYCQQERSGEFLSMLAIARVSIDYEFVPRMPMDIDVLIANEEESDALLSVHSSGLTFTVADLASDAMLNCRGGDMSALLTSLSYYAPREIWTNAWGEEWSVVKILEHELKRKVNLSDSDSTDRLYGLTYALRRRLAFDDKRLEIQYAIVDEYLERMKDFALSIQNEDGSFNGAFFTRKGKSLNPDDDFAATAHFARWLTILYHSSALDDPQLTKMIEFLVSELEQRQENWNPSEMSQKDVRAVAYALQAIAIYQQRWATKNN